MLAVAIASACAVLYVGMVARHVKGPARVVKVVPALALVTLLPSPALAAAMVFSALGDAFLLDKARFFLPGLGAFLVAHLCFMGGFLSLSGEAPGQPVLIGVSIAAAAVLTSLWPGLRGPLRVAVPVYAFALAGMVASASTLGALGFLGGVVFLVSDTLLAFNLFRGPLPGADVPVMITYFAAIGLLTASVLT